MDRSAEAMSVRGDEHVYRSSQRGKEESVAAHGNQLGSDRRGTPVPARSK